MLKLRVEVTLADVDIYFTSSQLILNLRQLRSLTIWPKLAS